jgi:serralysin
MIRLNRVMFAGLTTVTLTAAGLDEESEPWSMFGGPNRIVYDAASGLISYDTDGAGGSDGIAFARLAPGTALSAADFVVV